MRPSHPVLGAARGRDLAVRLAAVLDRQEGLCRAMEALADGLPRPDTHAALRLTARLHPTLRRAHHVEERLVFPALAAARAELAPVLDRLRAEHREDEHHAADLHEAMRGFVAGRSGPGPGGPAGAEEIGYMLRGLFVALGRHVAFERDCLLPLCAGARAP